MNPAVELNLALILFLPWFAILGALFWFFPRQPRGGARTVFDSASLLVAVAAFVVANQWALGYADRAYGRLWPQVLATSVAYGVFLLVLAIAWGVRRAWLRRRGG
ncbi:hypothetical protein SD81_016095 [Tolypothrix campylonemoides VB511288]|nr:hypothetical protein SD81_016095 [Tolypothrix campylonemoides VB511288]